MTAEDTRAYANGEVVVLPTTDPGTPESDAA